MKLRNKNTGKIGELHYSPDKEYPFTVSAKDPLQTGIYKTLGAVLKDWTDFIVHEPAEPLIKDEKIRKAVRAWAEANGITNIYCYQYKRTCEFACENLVLDRYATIRFIGDDIIDKNHNNNTYTITELCGDEE